jgi:hypothetical protein
MTFLGFFLRKAHTTSLGRLMKCFGSLGSVKSVCVKITFLRECKNANSITLNVSVPFSVAIAKTYLRVMLNVFSHQE